VRPPRETQVGRAFASGAETASATSHLPHSDSVARPRLPSGSAENPKRVGETQTSIHRKSSTPRIACLLVPALALAAELRADPELRGRPLAIATAPGPRGEVIACSPEAERAGVRVGSGVVHARAACAALAVRVLSPAKERAAREALRDAALACAPRAELAPPATGFYAAESAVFVDARGVGALYRSEAGFAAALTARAEKLGLPAVVAIADTRGTALIAARLLARGTPLDSETCDEVKASENKSSQHSRAGEAPQRSSSNARASAMTKRLPSGSVEAASGARSEPEPSEASEVKKERGARLDVKNALTHAPLMRPGPAQSPSAHVVAAGGDSAFLAPLALDLLNPDDALADALSRFGLRRVEDLLRTPERALVNRLGPALLPLLALARGEDSAPPPRAPDAAQFAEGTELEAPVAQQEPLLFVLRGLLARLAERLACRGLAFGALTLELALDGGGRDVRTLGLAAPTLDVRVVLRLAALALDATPPGAAALAVSVTTEGAALRGDQLDFFAPAGPAPAALSRTLAELAALCGPERVGAPALADAHRPDAYALAPFVLPARLAGEARTGARRRIHRARRARGRHGPRARPRGARAAPAARRRGAECARRAALAAERTRERRSRALRRAVAHHRPVVERRALRLRSLRRADQRRQRRAPPPRPAARALGDRRRVRLSPDAAQHAAARRGSGMQGQTLQSCKVVSGDRAAAGG
jgi:nucleotidyltransferase/DNA polymerase involved in DNA repair